MNRRGFLLRVLATVGILAAVLLPPARMSLFQPGLEVPVTSYSDSTDGGGSRGRIEIGPVLRFIYRLEDPKPFPYAALVLPLEHLDGLDLGDYRSLEVRARGTRSLGIITQFLVRLPAESRKNPREVDRLLKANLPLGREWRTARLELRDFVIPEWWRAEFALADSTPGDRSGRAVRLELAGGDNLFLPKHVEDTLEISHIVLEKDRTARYPWAAALLLLAWIPWEGLRRRGRGIGHGPGGGHDPLDLRDGKILHYEKRVLDDPDEADWRKVEAYLATHYRDEPMNVRLLSKATGIPSPRINPLMERFAGSPLIAYVNAIRLAEGARLLRETSLPIKQIAFEVGYSTVAHFNRLFKEAQGSAPTAYRQEKRGVPEG